ncbi:hypothetical protein D3C73_1127270 [compost metagenome]
MQINRQGSGHVVITRTRKLQSVRGGRNKPGVRGLANHHEGFKRLRHLFVRQTVVAMPSLRVQLEQPVLFESGQMRARGGGTYVCDNGHFGTGSRVTIHQRAKHFRPRRFRNSAGDPGKGKLIALAIHISFLSESSA